MKHRLLLLLRYYLFWLFAFWIFKAVFLIYHFKTYSKYSISKIFNVFLYGSKLDLSFSAYITILPLLLLVFSSFFKTKLFEKIIYYYTLILIPLITFCCIADLEIFKWWGTRLDSTILKYLKTPQEAMASIWMSPVLLLVCGAIIISLLFIYFFKKFIVKINEPPVKASFLSAFILLLFAPVLVILIRGGLQLSPMNQSAVCFSNNQYLNNAAINPLWNFSYSLIENNHSESNPFKYVSDQEAINRCKNLYSADSSQIVQMIKKGKLNVLLIVWESFTAKTVEKLGGKKDITPQFDKLIPEGILFTNIYASGHRSEKGLISLLSSFPAQPITSIMNNTLKAAKLPALAKVFYKENYATSFYYGGEPEFCNIKSYLINSNYKNIISKEDFPKETWNSKWGAHDEVVYERVHQDLNKSTQPFFTTFFTLSSHEPFEIPIGPHLPPKDQEALFLNSVYYADSCLGDFITKAKKEAWWDNTLIIITADHGHPLPTLNGVHEVTHLPSEFHIPMLWLGGALTKRDTVVTTIGSQTDLSNTLLNQMNLPVKEFEFSKNLLSVHPSSFAYYAYINGIGFLTNNGYFVFDNVSKKFIEKEPNVTEDDVLNGKAYLQHSFQEYLNK